jgi:general stress protein 26
MTRGELLQFMQAQPLAVQASVSDNGMPQTAVVGIVVSERFEIFFDTVDTSRKVQNLRRNSNISFVLGGMATGNECTVQFEGIADEPDGEELKRLKDLYFSRFPDGRERQTWPGVMYLRATPIWIRYTEFNRTRSQIVEFNFKDKVVAQVSP